MTRRRRSTGSFPTLGSYDALPLRRPGMWVAMLGVVATFTFQEALAHLFGTRTTVVPVFVVTALYALPSVYAALGLGFYASLVVSAAATVFASVNMVHYLVAGDLSDTWADNIQIVIVDVIAVLVGHFAEVSRKARDRAEAAMAAHREAEERYRDLFRSTLVRGHEEERRRIAQEIHDAPVQMLVQLCRLVDEAAAEKGGSSEGDCEAALGRARELARGAVDNLRMIAKGLRPAVLDDLGVVRALSGLVAEVSTRSSIDVSFSVEGSEVGLEPEAELALYRIAQESLRNAERHAGAKSAEVRLAYSGSPGGPGEVVLTVEDDGRGLEGAPEGGDEGGLGILGMSERAEAVGGELVISSIAGPDADRDSGVRGTRVQVRVPFGYPGG